ncbi:MBL fold metallo-hydrolase [Klebsiella sp. CN_Kp116]|uniref:MBL fold metallo-hydrolase n=1 Tax=unclassified Klebsiella TaxID=2608929 RepID=UPI0032B5DC06
MEITVLVDNNTFIDRYLIGEPGVSYLIECDGIKILFDTGYSDVFLKNAQILNVDLLDIDTIVFSHGHNDHTWGLNHLVQYYDRAINPPTKKIQLTCHPSALIQKYYNSKPIGINSILEENHFLFKKTLSTTPLFITKNVIFLGQIPRNNNFEATESIGHTLDHCGVLLDDFVLDDSALAVKTKKGIVVITGCSHAGITNIIEYAKLVTGETHVVSVIGGFHLQNADLNTLSKTGEYLKELSADSLYPCHCTDLAAKIKLASYVTINEVGVGLKLHFPLIEE